MISAYLRTMGEERSFTCVDIDAFALHSTKRNLPSQVNSPVNVLASDGLSEVSERFDFIVSNPPFHQGVKTHYAVTEAFLKTSYQHLNVGGELRIVANSFLKYPPIIEGVFGQCKTLLSKEVFSIYQARKKQK